MHVIPAEPGWIVKFRDGSTSPVIAWAIDFSLPQEGVQALPVTLEYAPLKMYELIPPCP